MVSIKDVRVSNGVLKSLPPGLVAVFVGATGGIGSNTVKQLTMHANAPTVYIIGRSKESAAPLLAELKKLNPQGTFNFIEGQVSLVKEVDRICDEIIAKEQKVDLLFVSSGLLSLGGRQGKFIAL
jgi:NAD(P)-dependent dehydrogenase (short-subunit alcohol dehydrogenase family)